MLLRSITKHVKDQNWFAVALDFLIVLAGILIAFQITNWNEDRNDRAELASTEIALQSDLGRNYFNAAERISLADCRTAQLSGLADLLLAPGERWEGMPRDNTNDSRRAIDPVLRSPSRVWGSRLWETSLARGTFNQMAADRREEMDLIFQQTEHANTLQENIQALQARLKILGRTTELSRTDRLRYFDILSEIDEHSVFLELISGQIMSGIEQIGISLDEATKSELRDYLTERNAARKAVYGACAKPITLPFLEEIETETTP
jgi:hypothetical protein